MSYEVDIVADSVGPNGARITTFALKYPRLIHSEFMTHRMFSRNASSTRAIPTAKMIEWIERDPAMPVYWGKNQRGMQATAELTPDQIEWAKRDWLIARNQAVHVAKSLIELGVHKQIASRILEPWAHINVVITATSFDNFFALRCHKAAMPEVQVLAYKMARAYRDSVPIELGHGSWHLPFVTQDELAELWVLGGDGSQTHDPMLLFEEESRLLKLSVARCARVSYKTFDGKEPDPASDVVLHDALLANGHWSPFEHQARSLGWAGGHSGNLVGWTQYRQTLPKGVHTSFDFSTLDAIDGDFSV